MMVLSSLTCSNTATQTTHGASLQQEIVKFICLCLLEVELCTNSRLAQLL